MDLTVAIENQIRLRPHDCKYCLVLQSRRRKATFCVVWRPVGVPQGLTSHDHLCRRCVVGIVAMSRDAEVKVSTIITSMPWQKIPLGFRQAMQESVAELS